MKEIERNFDNLLGILVDATLKESEEGNEIRAQAAETLGQLGDRRAIDPLLTRLQDKDEDTEVRVQAALSLANLKAENAIDSLIEIVEGVIYKDSRDNTVAWWAIDALAVFKDARVIPLLVDACSNYDVDIRKSACAALTHFGEGAVIPLIDALTKSPSEPVFLIKALGRIGDFRARIPIAQILNNKTAHRYWRAEAAEALGQVGHEYALELLAKIYEDMDEDEYVRRCAILGLGFTHDPRAFNLLLEASTSVNHRIRWDAATALGALGDSRANEQLVNLLGDEEEQVRSCAVKALGMVGDETAIIPLQRLQNTGRGGVLFPFTIQTAVDHIRKRHQA